MKRISKALAAGAGAAFAAFTATLVKDGTPADTAGWMALIGAALGVGITAAIVTYFAPANIPAVPASPALRPGGVV